MSLGLTSQRTVLRTESIGKTDGKLHAQVARSWVAESFLLCSTHLGCRGLGALLELVSSACLDVRTGSSGSAIL